MFFQELSDDCGNKFLDINSIIILIGYDNILMLTKIMENISFMISECFTKQAVKQRQDEWN